MNVLGLDLGANSVGWALIAYEDNRPIRLLAAGCRVFDAGAEGQHPDAAAPLVRPLIRVEVAVVDEPAGARPV